MSLEAGNNIDGSYPGTTCYHTGTQVTVDPLTDRCYGWNSAGGDGVYSYATCCQSSDSKVTLECIGMFSETEPASGNGVTSVSCPSNDYFMTSCGGWYVSV